MWRHNNRKNPYHTYILKPRSNTEELIEQYREAFYEDGAEATLNSVL